MKKSKFSEDDTVSISSKRSKIDNDQVIKEEVTTSTTISTSTTCTTLAPIVCDPSNDHTSNIDVSSPSHALGPPTLYCDGAHVIRRVLEVDGKFIALKKGDHCMAPLNLARGLNASVDSFVDQLADFDLVQFHHHFIVLDNVADIENENDKLSSSEEKKEAYVAEFTNNPDDFIHKANRIGYSAAFLDKASYKKTPLSDYKGCVIFKVIEDNDTLDSEIARNLVVEKCIKSIHKSNNNNYPNTYNLFQSNCEHAATEVLYSVKKMQTLDNSSSSSSSKSVKYKSMNVNTINNQSEDIQRRGVVNNSFFSSYKLNKYFNDLIGKVHNTTTRSSPQVTFAYWQIFRFSLQILGVIFLHQIHAKWWFWAFIGYSILSAAPVLMQSVFNLIIIIYKLNKLFVRGSLKKGSFRHLLFKELFRCILVGFGTSLLILFMPIAVWFKKWPLSLASIVALFGFIILNSLYSIIVKAIHKIILFIKKIYRRHFRKTSNSSSSPSVSPLTSTSTSMYKSEPVQLFQKQQVEIDKKKQ